MIYRVLLIVYLICANRLLFCQEILFTGQPGESVIGLGKIKNIFYAPDGKCVYAVGETGVYLYDAQSNNPKPVRQVVSMTEEVDNAVLSPDGRRLICYSVPLGYYSEERKVLLVDTETGSILSHMDDRYPIELTACFSGDGAKVIVTGYYKTFYNPLTGNMISSTENRDYYYSVVFSRDRHSAVLGASNCMKTADSETLQAVKTFPFDSSTPLDSSVYSQLLLSSDKNFIVFTSQRIPVSIEDKKIYTVNILNTQTGKIIYTNSTETRNILVSFTQDDSSFLYINGKGEVVIQKKDTGEILTMFSTGISVQSVSLSPDDSTLAIVASNSDIFFYNLSSSILVKKIPNTIFQSIIYHPNGHLAFIQKQSESYVYDLRRSEISSPITHSYNANSVAFTPQGVLALDYSQKGIINVIELLTDQNVFSVQFSQLWANGNSPGQLHEIIPFFQPKELWSNTHYPNPLLAVLY